MTTDQPTRSLRAPVPIRPASGDATTRPPTELRSLVRRRIGWVALLLACLFGAFVLLALVVSGPDGARVYTVDAVLFASSAALFGLTRSSRVSDELVTAAGLVFMVCAVGLIQVGNIGSVWSTHHHLPLTTFGCVLLVAMPLIVPTTLVRTALAAAAAAATAPLGVALIAAEHGPVVGGRDYFDVSVAPLFAGLLAVGGSRVVYGLGLEIARARRLGAYKLTELLGRGGMGEVWRAEHRLLARPAAVKLIRPEKTDDRAIHSRRFEREAQVTARLQSPHTVQLFDFGVSSDGAYYYAMELLDGMDLQTLVRRHGKQPAARVVDILRQACHSLDEAHHAGLVHRDIKPANIYLCTYGRDVDFVKVLDFGLVALQSRAAAEQPDGPLTNENVVQGTPPYMAPEMISTPSAVGPAADLYALGCVAYFLLSGSLVFDSKSPVEQLANHLHTAPPHLSSRAPEVPGELAELVMSCLAKQPAGRPASAAELAERLNQLSLETPWAPVDARRWWSQHAT